MATSIKKSASKRRQKIPKKTPRKKAVPKKTVRKKKVQNPRVERTRNLGSQTSSEFFSKIRSALRNISRFWKPAAQAKLLARVPNTSSNAKLKWQYKCNHCSKLHRSEDVAVHHMIDAGSLRCFEDLPGFAERLFCEDVSLYEVLCHSCHANHHKKQKEDLKEK